jgi:cation-transporting P-type ATPase 13A2
LLNEKLNLGDSMTENSELSWTCVQDQRLTLNPHSLIPNPIPQEVLSEFPPHNQYGIVDYSLAISGDVFRWIVDFAPIDILERVSFFSFMINDDVDACQRTNFR